MNSIELGAWPDWVVGLFTGVLVVFTWLQYRLSVRSARETGAALKVAEQSAAAAVKAAEVADLNMRTSQRAYLFANFTSRTLGNSIVLEYGPERATYLMTDALVTNQGNTPAHDVELWIHQVVTSEANPVLMPDDPLVENTQGVLGPKGEARSGYVFLTRPQVDAAYRRQAAIYILVRVAYRDAFGEQRHTQLGVRLEIFVDPSIWFESGAYEGVFGHVSVGDLSSSS